MESFGDSQNDGFEIGILNLKAQNEDKNRTVNGKVTNRTYFLELSLAFDKI